MQPLFEVDHVGLLVESLERSAAPIRELGLQVGRFEKFGQDTVEAYVGEGCPSRLLLIEAGPEGPYRRALEKRGPGLHHIGIRVPTIESLLNGLDGSDWLLHPRSLVSVPNESTAWLCRPGIPFLVEAHLGVGARSGDYQIERLEIPFASENLNTIAMLFGGYILRSSGPEARIFIGGKPIPLSKILSP